MSKPNNYFEDLREDDSDAVSAVNYELRALLQHKFEASVRKHTHSSVEFVLESDNRNFIEFLMNKIQLLGNKSDFLSDKCLGFAINTDANKKHIEALLETNSILKNRLEIVEGVFLKPYVDNNTALKESIDNIINSIDAVIEPPLPKSYTSVKTSKAHAMTVKHIHAYSKDLCFNTHVIIDGVDYYVKTIAYESGYGNSLSDIAVGVGLAP